MNEVLKLDSFEEVYWLLDGREREWIDRVYLQLQKNLAVGRPLRYDWFREKRCDGRSVHFVVDEIKKRAIFIAVGNKKDQESIIQKVIEHKEYYLSLLR